MKSVVILSTGNELLYGNTIDTNSSYISAVLFPTNFKVKFHLVVGDTVDEIKRAIEYSSQNADIIIITGGLGPTDDDNTIEALRRIFKFSLSVEQSAAKKMETLFKKIGRDVNKFDLKMAAVPDNALIINNKYGLAPGFILNYGERMIIALPGVPAEMEYMFGHEVMPYLQKQCGLESADNLTLRVAGLKESEVNNSISSMKINMEGIRWGITAKSGICTITFVPGKEPLDKEGIINEAERIFKKRMIAEQYEKPEEELLALLKSKNNTIAVAESCTGGLISKRLTDIPGASAVFRGSIIAYSDEVKVSHLNILPESIKKFGAVSEEVAGRMAEGIRSIFSSGIGISATGIAGPQGGTEEKPVGMVCFGFASDSGTKTFTRNFAGNRERIRNFSSLFIIDYLRRQFK